MKKSRPTDDPPLDELDPLLDVIANELVERFLAEQEATDQGHEADGTTNGRRPSVRRSR